MTNSRLTRRTTMGLGLGVVAALGGTTIVNAEGTKTLRARISNDIQILDPGYPLTSSEALVQALIFSNLVRLKPSDTIDWIMDAAESCDQIDPTHIAFKLRPGLMWSNGFGEVTAEDVKYSYERIADPAMASPYAGDWEFLDHVEVADKRSGVIVMKEAFAPLWYTVLPWGSGMIVCKAAVDALPEKKFTTEPPATCGPYVIQEWIPKQRLTLVRDPQWTGSSTEFDRIDILVISDDKSAELAFEANELDVTSVSVSSLPIYKENPPADGTIVVTPSINYFWIGMNVEHPTFQDIRVRHAVQHAVDVDAILLGAFSGVVERATGIVAPSLVGHRPANLIPTRDVAKAKALLAEAGLPDGFSCKFTVENLAASLSVGQIVQSSLAEAGIQVEIEQLDEGAFWGMADHADQLQGLQMTYKNYINTPDASWATVWFLPEQIDVWNWERFNDPRFAELHQAALRELDVAKRAAMYVEMQDLMEKSGAYIFVTHGVNTALYRDSFKPAFTPSLLSWNLRDWTST
ncbi:MAG: peptide ABC transporter substrate-binding protein [Alphaproteobacteria bacterium]|nr:peptide ABC transporter substrate-binding protein [Alphaproteobacteria bacterium]